MNSLELEAIRRRQAIRTAADPATIPPEAARAVLADVGVYLTRIAAEIYQGRKGGPDTGELIYASGLRERARQIAADRALADLSELIAFATEATRVLTGINQETAAILEIDGD